MIPHLSDDRLIANTKSLFAEERRLDLEVLRHLYEIERRRLFLERGFPSLFEMCIQEFKLSPASAQRRISAMRLLKEVPEVAPKIQTGELSISVLAQTQSFLRAEKKQDHHYSKQDKIELIRSFENKSARDVERELAAKNPAIKQYEVMKPVSATQSRLTLVIDNDTKAMLDQIRDLISHANPDMTYEGVIARAAKLLLEKELKKIQTTERASNKVTTRTQHPQTPGLLPTSEVKFNTAESDSQTRLESSSKHRSRRARIHSKSQSTHRDRVKLGPTTHSVLEIKSLESPPDSASAPDFMQSEFELPSAQSKNPQKNPRGPRTPSASLKRLIWQRDRACCTYIDPKTGKKCGATAFLQHDHIQPWALGGTTSADNLRLFCGAHNKNRAALT